MLEASGMASRSSGVEKWRGLAVDLHLGVLDVGVDPTHALDQFLPRHAVREVEAGSDPARFFGETCQQHRESFASLRMSVWSASYQSC